MQAHPHTSCHPLRHENLPATRSSSKLPTSTHVVLTESRASDQEEESAFDSDRRSGVACSPALTRPHLLLTHKFGVSSLSATSPTLDSRVRRPRSYSTDECSLSLFQTPEVCGFRGSSLPSFLPRALISFNPTNRRTCSWLLARHRHLRVDAASFARHCHHRVSAAFTRWWHCSSPPSPGRCGLSCSFCSSRRPADGIRSDSPALRRTVHVLFVIFLFCLLFV